MNKFEDERGIIEDLKAGKDWSVTYISFKKGAVRGNHLHRATLQHDFVLSGKFEFKHGHSSKYIEAGDDVTISPGIAHAYRALEDGEIVSMCKGVRIGENYEEDTFRLSPEEKLL